MINVNRPVLTQPFNTFVVTVGATPVQLVPNQDKTSLVESFVLSVDAASASVFAGDSNVTVGSGLEIVAGGGPALFANRNQWQQYDVMFPLLELTRTLQCRELQPFNIPYIVWDLSQWYVVCGVASSVRVAAFRAQYT